MARFRGVVVGMKGGSISRLGGARGGMRVELNGWNLGVEVVAYVDDEDRDCFDVFETGGSGSRAASKLIVTLKEEK